MSTAFAESGRPLRSQELRKPMNAPASACARRSELATAVDPSRGRCGWVFRVQLVLCNRYGLPMVKFKMARRQGATREHVLCDLCPRSNAGAGPFSTQPSGPQFFGRIFASLGRPVSQRIQALRSLLEIRPNSSRPLSSHTCYTTLVTKRRKTSG